VTHAEFIFNLKNTHHFTWSQLAARLKTSEILLKKIKCGDRRISPFLKLKISQSFKIKLDEIESQLKEV